MKRTPIVGGNWKMHNGPTKTQEYFDLFEGPSGDTEVFIAPAAIAHASAAVHKQEHVMLAGQDYNLPSEQGDTTAGISLEMFQDEALQTQYMILGHSECRRDGDSDETINVKMKKLVQDSSIHPVLCIGENEQQRESNLFESTIRNQIEKNLEGIESDKLNSLVIAYEPVWAIGTGKTATPELAQEACKIVRNIISEVFGGEFAAMLRIQYGGSVKPANAEALIIQEDIDGFLIGGASLDPKSFSQIIEIVEQNS